ncbi:MAG TPA: ABC transporter permease [Acidimicrobiales bacterium]|nr:ABC transporter permease [Acidimicrobiales bacterium]
MRVLADYALLVQWQARRISWLLPLIVGVQAVLSVGIIVGFGFLLPEVDPDTALFLTTGAPTLLLLVVGLVLVPQMVSESKTEGTYGWMRALPVPRMAFLAADATVWFVAMLPGLVVALLVANYHYDLTLSISPLLVVAVALVGLTATGVGYAIASFVPPMITLLLSNLLLFGALMFSPVNFPAERLPGWLQAVHQVLPITAMADVMRGTLARDTFELGLGPFLVLAAWCGVGFAASYVALNRRG